MKLDTQQESTTATHTTVPKLLVSVRNVTEAKAALSGGADIIDVKEPLLGSLGQADSETLQRVVDCVAGRVAVTAALGELVADENTPSHAHSLVHLPKDLFAAKIGLANTATNEVEADPDHHDWANDWRLRWTNLKEEKSQHAWPGKRVAVAYADYLTSSSPLPRKVATEGYRLGCEFLLIDTYQKTQSLAELLNNRHLANALDSCVEATKLLGMRLVVAGSLVSRDLPMILTRWTPDLVAVRGAVCDGDRTHRISATKVVEFKAALLNAVPSITHKDNPS